MPNQTMIIRRSSRQQAAHIACLVPMNTVRFSGRCHVSHGRLFLYVLRPRRLRNASCDVPIVHRV